MTAAATGRTVSPSRPLPAVKPLKITTYAAHQMDTFGNKAAANVIADIKIAVPTSPSSHRSPGDRPTAHQTPTWATIATNP